ncbi:MAG: CotH kinase family protein [Bacteroidales bacterium]|nr:CotH kinase family protein [Bacteroidales bacterium]
MCGCTEKTYWTYKKGKSIIAELHLVIAFCLLFPGCRKTPESPDPTTLYYIEIPDSIVSFNYSYDTLYINSNVSLMDGQLVCRRDSWRESGKNDDAPSSLPIAEIRHLGENNYRVILMDSSEYFVYEGSYRLEWRGIIAGDADDDTGLVVSSSFKVCKPFFTGLPALVLNTPDAVPIVSKTQWITGAEMVLFDENGHQLYQGGLEIKGRGNSTWNAPKKPYSLRLDTKAGLFDMLPHRRWVLLANYLDRTLLRNHLAFFLANVQGNSFGWTPHGHFVELILNGKHLGNYYLCEKIGVDENRINLQNNTSLDADISFMVEMDTNFDEVNKFRTPVRQLPVMIHEPDENDLTAEQASYIENYFSRLEQLIYNSNSLSEESYGCLLDLDSYVDYWLINELTGNTESWWPKSVFMYRDKGGKLIVGPVWDYDWGTFGKRYENKFCCLDCLWTRQLLLNGDFRNLAAERWNKLLPGLATVFDEIDRQKSRLSRSAAVDAGMWPNNRDINGDENLPFEEAVELLKKNLRERMDWISGHIHSIQ